MTTEVNHNYCVTHNVCRRPTSELLLYSEVIKFVYHNQMPYQPNLGIPSWFCTSDWGGWQWKAKLVKTGCLHQLSWSIPNHTEERLHDSGPQGKHNYCVVAWRTARFDIMLLSLCRHTSRGKLNAGQDVLSFSSLAFFTKTFPLGKLYLRTIVPITSSFKQIAGKKYINQVIKKHGRTPELQILRRSSNMWHKGGTEVW